VGIGPVAVGATLLLSPVVERPQVPSSVARRAPKCPDPSKSPPSRLQVASKSPPSRLQVASKSPPSRLLVASQSARHDFPAAGSSYEDPAEALGKWSCKWNRNRRGRTSRASARGSPTPRTVRTRIGASEFLQLPPPRSPILSASHRSLPPRYVITSQGCPSRPSLSSFSLSRPRAPTHVLSIPFSVSVAQPRFSSSSLATAPIRPPCFIAH
jgi:hypothetical protein